MTTHVIHAEAVITIEPRRTFDAFAKKLGYTKDAFWWYVVNHGYTPTTTEPLWKWDAWLAAFDAADLRDTQQDALR
jgi:hypothetical protein